MEDIDIRKFLPLAYIVGGILVLVVLVSWFVTPKYGSFELHKTPFSAESFTSFYKDRLYNYNGTAFYSVNPHNPQDITVLSAGLRLPAVEKLYWAGDSGALIVFGDTQTDGSLVEKELTARGLAFDNVTTNYIWYLDFKAGSLHLVSDAPIDSYNAYFSPEKRLFYFSTLPLHQEGDDADHSLPLWTYSTDTFERTVAVADVGSELTRYIGPCLDGEVCVVQEAKPNKQTLWTIADGKKKVLANGYNSVSPTSSPLLFIAEKNRKVGGVEHTEEDSEGGEHRDGDAELQADIFMLNIAKNNEKPTALHVGVGASLSATTYDNDKKFVLHDDSLLIDGMPAYRNAASDLFGTIQSQPEKYRLAGNEELTEIITGSLSYSSDGATILTGTEGGVYIHSPSSYDYKIESYDEKQLKNVAKPCIDKYTKHYEYTPEIRQVTVGILFDTNFASSIKDFSSCLVRTDKKTLVGHSYIVIGLDPSGRFVTN